MNWIVGGMLLLIVVGAGVYVYRAKKSGKKCIGCPDAASCSKKGCCSCANFSDTKE